MNNRLLYTLLIALYTSISCQNNKIKNNEIVILEPSDPDMLNPINYTEALSGYITNHLFQKLIDVDYKNPNLYVPVLADTLPISNKTSDHTMSITFHLRKGAKWDNETPVTIKDILFTLKVIKCPQVNNPFSKPYFESLKDIKLYDNDSLKFTILLDKIYFLAVSTFSDVPILPEYLYDPQKLLRKFSLKQIAAGKEDVLKEESLQKFASDFNSEKRSRNPDCIGGSGAYKFVEWKSNECIVLERKKNWWGDAFKNENCFFDSYPDKLIYKTISDPSTALNSLKSGSVDVMRSIKSKDFTELKQSSKFLKQFNSFSPIKYSFIYVGINNKSPFFIDIFTRKAMAHLVDTKRIISTVKYGLAKQIIGPIHPSKTLDYDTTISPYDFNPEEARKLLALSGWKNTNGDETIDKIIGGKRIEFEVNLIYNTSNIERQSVGLMIQEEAKKVGIKINLIGTSNSVLSEKCKKHNFDLMVGGWVTGPAPDDFKQLFHSNSILLDGGNYCNYLNEEVDTILDSIQIELDPTKRSILYKRFQKIIHEEVPMIFLWTPYENLAINKTIINPIISTTSPGYWEQSFIIKRTEN